MVTMKGRKGDEDEANVSKRSDGCGAVAAVSGLAPATPYPCVSCNITRYCARIRINDVSLKLRNYGLKLAHPY